MGTSPTPDLLLLYQGALQLTSNELVYCLHVLRKRWDANGEWPWLSIKEVSDAVGAAPRLVSRWKASLEERGYLECERRSQPGAGLRLADRHDLTNLLSALEELAPREWERRAAERQARRRRDESERAPLPAPSFAVEGRQSYLPVDCTTRRSLRRRPAQTTLNDKLIMLAVAGQGDKNVMLDAPTQGDSFDLALDDKNVITLDDKNVRAATTPKTTVLSYVSEPPIQKQAHSDAVDPDTPAVALASSRAHNGDVGDISNDTAESALDTTAGTLKGVASADRNPDSSRTEPQSSRGDDGAAADDPRVCDLCGSSFVTLTGHLGRCPGLRAERLRAQEVAGVGDRRNGAVEEGER